MDNNDVVQNEVVETNQQVANAPEQAAPQEKTLTVEEVNRIVGREKAAAAEKARKQAEAEYQAKLNAGQPHSQAMSETQAENPNVNVDDIYKQVQSKFEEDLRRRQEEAAAEKQRQEMQRVADEYYSKMANGKDAYEDFEEVVSTVNPASFPSVVYLANESDNTADIMYELAKNPQKLVTIDALIQRDPDAARLQVKKLSESISKNRQAKAEAANAQQPLSRMKPNTVVGSDNGPMTIRDYKSASWLRG